MAKVKKDMRIKDKTIREKNVKKKLKKISGWIENKTLRIRKLGKPLAARASRWGAPSGVALVILLALISFLLPKNDIQQPKEKLIKNPNDFETHLRLAEKFLENNQLEEAERSLLLAQKLQFLISNCPLRGIPSECQFPNNSVLGEKSDTKLNELWQQKHYSDPKDIKRLISDWEKIIEEKPNYRDGYLQLAILYYKIYENEKAKEYLDKALELDPNYEPARELEKLLENSLIQKMEGRKNFIK